MRPVGDDSCLERLNAQQALCTETIPFVGREPELHQLTQSLTLVHSGEIPVVLLTGGAGVGKTRLLQEWIYRLREKHETSRFTEDVVVWSTGGQAQGNGVAFSTLLHMIRNAMDDRTSLERQQLANRFPYLNVLFPELGGSVPEALTDAGLERLRRFESLRSLVVYLVGNRPTVIWLDDVHFADSDTLEWLIYVFRHTQGPPIMFIGTCNPSPASQNPVFAELQGVLTKQKHALTLQLADLSKEETLTLLQTQFSGWIDESLHGFIYDGTLGNPLFVVEILRNYSSTEGFIFTNNRWRVRETHTNHIPESITSLIKKRIQGLSPHEQDIVIFLAASEDSLPWSILSNAISMDETALNAALTDLLAAGYVVEVEKDWDPKFRIGRPMLKKIAGEMLSEPMMRQIHKRLSYAWRPNVTKAAYHIRLAGSQADVREAVDLFYEAGRYYLSHRAFRNAAEYLEQAWILLQQYRQASSPEVYQDIAFLLGEVLTHTERSAEALQVLSGIYHTSRSAVLRIRLKRLLAWVASSRSLEDCMRHIEDGLKLWDGQSENEDVAWMLNEQVMNSHNLSDLPMAHQALDRFRAYIRKFPSDRYSLLLGIREAHTGMIDWTNAVWKSRHDNGLLERAIRSGDPELVYDVYCLGGYRALLNGDYASAIRYASDATALVRYHSMVIHEISIRLMGCCALFVAGRWRQAEEEANALQVLSTSYDSQIAILCILDFRAMLYTLQGRYGEAMECGEQAKQLTDTVFLNNSVIPSQHQRSVAEVLLALLGQLPMPAHAVSVTWANSHGLTIFLQFIEGVQHLEVNSLETTAAIIERMRRVAPPNEYSYFSSVADCLAGLTATIQGNQTQALQRLHKSVEGFKHLGLVFETAFVQLEYAKTVQSTHPEQAKEYAQEALRGFENLGAAPFVEDARKICVIQRPTDERIHTTLTPRELEIAQLVSMGLSNKEISEKLFISIRTVSTHLDRVFKKTNVHSRTGLVAKIQNIGDQKA